MEDLSLSQAQLNPTNAVYYIAIPVGVLNTNIESNLQTITIRTNAEDNMESDLSKNYSIGKNIMNITDLTPKIREQCTVNLQAGRNAFNQENYTSTQPIQSPINPQPIPVAEKNDGNAVTAKIPTISKPRFKCTICNEILLKHSALQKHMFLHLEQKKCQCAHCPASYNLPENLEVHMILHNEGEPYCTICKRRFLRKASLKAHIINHQVEEFFKCPKCSDEFENEMDCAIHMEDHQEPQQCKVQEQIPNKCSVCTQSFTNNEEYKNHCLHHTKMKQVVQMKRRSKKISNKPAKHICYVCKKKFSKYCFLERHMRIHTGEKPFACHLCKSAFNQKGSLEVHLRSHTGSRPYKCTLCSARFVQKCNLRVHLERTHTVIGPDDKVFRCTLCVCVFKKMSSLSSHITKTHLSQEKPAGVFTEVMYQLKNLHNQLGLQKSITRTTSKDNKNGAGLDEIIQSSTIKDVNLIDTSRMDSIKLHSVKQRKIGSYQWYICNYCCKEFRKPSDLVRHIRVHTKEKPYKCDICNQTFTLQSTLTYHQKTHNRDKTFQCVICGKSFKANKILSYHMKKHDKVIAKNNNEFTCRICNRVFKFVQDINEHMQVHRINRVNKPIDVPSRPAGINIIMQQPMIETPDGMFPLPEPRSSANYSEEELQKRQHKCSQCGAAFIKRHYLKRHMLIHSKIRKHHCTICSKAFYSSYALKEHLKFHSGQRNYKCHECGKTFKTSGILKRHILTHSELRPYICPYCRMTFKTAAFCRKHINLHKRDINFEVHAMNETGEIDELFSDQVVDIEGELENDTSILSNEVEDIGVEAMSCAEQQNHVEQFSSSIQPTKVLFTDENGIIVTTAMDEADEEHQFHPSFVEPVNEASAYVTNLLLKEERHAGSLIGSQPILQQNPEGTYELVYLNNEYVPPLSTTSFNDSLISKITEPFYLNDSDTSTPNVVISGNFAIPAENNQMYYEQSSEVNNTEVSYNASLELTNGLVYANELSENVRYRKTDPNIKTEKSDEMEENDPLEEYDQPHELVEDTCEELQNESANEQIFSDSEINPSPERTVPCTLCKKSFSSIADLSKHHCDDYNNSKLKEDDDLIGDYECAVCGKTYITQAALKKHELQHKKKKSLSKVCSFCQKSFKKRCDVVRHERIHTGEKPFKCEKCGKSFSLKSTLTSHYRIHNPSNKKEFVCPVCGANFAFRSSLKVHSRIHTGSMPFQCPLCPKTFRTSGNKIAHMISHEKPVDQRKSRKDIINEILASVVMDSNNENIQQQINQEIIDNNGVEIPQFDKDPMHIVTESEGNSIMLSIPNPSDVGTEPLLLQFDNMLLQTGIGGLSPNGEDDPDIPNEFIDIADINLSEENEEPQIVKNVSRNFECDICLKKYCRKTVLTKHKKTHILKCTPCNLQFDNAESHMEHVGTHINDKVSCHLCANKFTSEKNLKAHLKRIHNIIIV